MKFKIGDKVKYKDAFKSSEADIRKAISTTSGDKLLEFPQGYNFQPNSSRALKSKNLGVLDLWFDAVYESNEVTVKLSNNRTATIKSKTEGIISITNGEKVKVNAKEVIDAYFAISGLGGLGGYRIIINEFSLGCQSFTLNDLLLVNNAFLNFN